MGGMANLLSKAERQAIDRKIIAGVSKHINKNIVLNGASVSPKDITNVLQSVMAADDTCDALRMQLAEAVKAAKAAEKAAKVLKTSLKQYVVAHFGESNPAIVDFGYSPRKVAQKTVAEKYLTVEKQLATRAARHTMGSHQKAAIHGQVATPAPQPQPQPVVTNGTSGVTQSLLALNGAGH
jgi:hypothetical protein